MMLKLKSTGALVLLAMFGVMMVGSNASAESLSSPGFGRYRPNPQPNPYAVAGGFAVGGARAPMGAPRPLPVAPRPVGRPPVGGGMVAMQGSHGIDTFNPIVAGVRGAVAVRGGGRPCAGNVSRCHRPCGGVRRCGGGRRSFSVSVSFRSCRGGGGFGMRRGCRRRC